MRARRTHPASFSDSPALQPAAASPVSFDIVSLPSRRRCASASLINYTKNRIPFRHTVRIEPLVNTYGQIRMIKAVSSDIDVLVPPEAQDERGLFNDALPPLIYS